MELLATDYVLIKDGKRMESLDIIYAEESLSELSEDVRKYAVRMTDLPMLIQIEYTDFLTFQQLS